MHWRFITTPSWLAIYSPSPSLTKVRVCVVSRCSRCCFSRWLMRSLTRLDAPAPGRHLRTDRSDRIAVSCEGQYQYELCTFLFSQTWPLAGCLYVLMSRRFPLQLVISIQSWSCVICWIVRWPFCLSSLRPQRISNSSSRAFYIKLIDSRLPLENVSFRSIY